MGQLDFSIPTALAVALSNAILFPGWLILTKRLSVLSERHALRFLVAAAVTCVAWLLCMSLFAAWRPSSPAEAAECVASLGGAFVFYLQVWGLLTRGYTLGILLTLLHEGRPLTTDEISTRYRDGDGLQWIMHHRLGGLCAAGMIKREADTLTLVKFPGAFIAKMYGLSVAVLGLRRTG